MDSLLKNTKDCTFRINAFTLRSGILVVLAFAAIQTSGRADLAQTQSAFAIARIKYGGGGDWYGNKTSLNNLLGFLSENTNINAAKKEVYVELTDEALFNHNFLYLAGHGNIKFSVPEADRLRIFLSNGGFLWADDDYGMDQFFRREMKKVFPDADFVPIPYGHEIFHTYFDFAEGLPKIHEHDGGPPQAYGLFVDGRLVCFYSKNTDISDGMEDRSVHNIDQQTHLAALRMGTNIVIYALTN